ncbi:MAG: tetratricopeptide repeat protein [Desulfobacterales bacterium]|nr:tetratricopeptide repeat protein [Desulfobacterales bacterium]
MNDPLKNLFNHRSASKDFLLSKTEALVVPDAASQEQPQLLEALSQDFPDLLAGQAFVERALAELETVDTFQASIIRIDPLDADNLDRDDTPPITLQLSVARILDHFCENQSWQWGKLDRDIFGCFQPTVNDTGETNQGLALKAALDGLQPATFSIGCTQFPLIDYQPEEILDNARKALDHATFFGPGSVVDFDSVSLNISGDRYYQMGDVNQAMAEFNRALELDPGNVNVHNSLGVCYGVLGAYEKAVKIFETSAGLAPDELMPVYNIGLAKLMIGDKETALVSFLAAAQKDPEVFEPTFQVGRLYFETGKTKKARSFLEKATALNPENATAHRYLGLCLLDLKKDAAAVTMLKKAVQLNPNDAPALSALGYLFDRMGENPDITTIFCRQSVEIAPENGLFHFRLAQLLAKKGSLEEALKEFETAQQLGHDVGKMIETVKDRIAIEI